MRSLTLGLFVFATACARPAAPRPTPATAAPAAAPPSARAASAASASTAPFVFVTDLRAATDKARAERKLLFVDAWAPWCHTCLSMKHYVLGDASLRPLGQRVVFAAVDTDRPESAAFLEHHAVTVWPTFFVLDPATDTVLGVWPGSASVSELRGFVEESVRAGEAHGPALDEVLATLVQARAAHARRDFSGAAARYQAVVAKASGARRSEALVGWIEALYAARDWAACARVSEAHLRDVEGAAMPADFASFVLSCADHLEPKAAERLRRGAVSRLAELTASPPAEASADDRADALLSLAEGLEALRDVAGARAARERALAVLERAASAAPTPEMAATYDYARANAYVALGRAPDAIALLEDRERQMPDSYEPAARLADVLAKIGRYREALGAVERAISRAYGPRKLRYLKLRADIQSKLGDSAAQIASLREEVAGYEALAPGHANEERLADARRRLESALTAAGRKP